MVKQKGRILGIDYGLARLGLAISDESKILASPLPTLSAAKKTEETVKRLVQELERIERERESTIQSIVIGLPLMMSGKTGFIADEVKHFATLLEQAVTIPIILWDERLTTVQAERSLREANLSRKKRSKVVDTVAAVIILQNYLDAQHEILANEI